MSETTVRSKRFASSRVASRQSSLGHSVESTISLSTTADQLVEHLVELGHAAPAAGRPAGPATSSGTTTLAGCRARSPPSRTRITSAQTDRSPAGTLHRAVQLEPVLVFRSREEQDRPRRMALGEPGERPLRRLPPSPPAPTRGASSRSCAVRRRARADSLVAQLRPARARSRRRSTPSLVAPPRAPVALDQLVGARRAPRARRVVRERRTVAPPRRDDRVDERPLLLDLVRRA